MLSSFFYRSVFFLCLPLFSMSTWCVEEEKPKPLKESRPQLEKKAFKFQREGSTFEVSFYLFPEFFYGKNLSLLNNRNPADRTVVFRHFIDSFATYSYSNGTIDFFKAKCGVRSRSIWGNNTSVLEINEREIRELDTVFGAHKHGISLNEIWIRELWLEVGLNEILGLPFCNRHVLTCGAFFFEIGRGISLGALYPSMPPALGFFIDAQIDQYAFGAKLSGDLIANRLAYDVYGAIWGDKSATYDQTNQIVRGNQYGYRGNGARGFGMVNYVVASRLKWYPIKIETENGNAAPGNETKEKEAYKEQLNREGKQASGEKAKAEEKTEKKDEKVDQKKEEKVEEKKKEEKSEFEKVYFEPYAIYNHNPEIRLDLLNDGISDLATFGLMGEFVFGSFEWGFEYAFNRGHLRAAGIDRNTHVLADDEGKVVIVDDQVVDTRTGANALVKEEREKIIKRSEYGGRYNSRVLKHGDFLKNKKFRFRDPFEIRYRGYFFVADASYIVCKDVFKVSAAIGVASGDEDPRKKLLLEKKGDRSVDYNGFISLNESYAGKRVTSVLFFNGFGVFPRVIDIGLEGLREDSTVINLTGFTNLVYMGVSADYYYKNTFRKWRVCPNLLFYWQEEPSRIFESKLKKKREGERESRRDEEFVHKVGFLNDFLGTELNVVAEYEVIKDLTFFILSGIFVPGFHFKQIKGMPLNGAQAQFIKDRKGNEPLLGDDTAYCFNIGFKYTF